MDFMHFIKIKEIKNRLATKELAIVFAKMLQSG